MKFNKQVEKSELPFKQEFEKIISLSPNTTEQIDRIVEIENEINLLSSKKLKAQEDLIKTTRQHWKNLKVGNYSLRDKCLSVYVSKALEKRSLKFMNLLIKSLKNRGHQVYQHSYRGTVANVFDVEIEIHLREITRRIPAKEVYNTSTYVPTGVLALKVNRWIDQKEFKDGKKEQIEDKIAKVVAHLELDALNEIETQKRIEEQSIKREKEKEAERQRVERIEKEKKRLTKLLDQSKKFKHAKEIRDYVDAVKDKAILENRFNDQVECWLSWAKSKADSMDPLLLSFKDLFNEFED